MNIRHHQIKESLSLSRTAIALAWTCAACAALLSGSARAQSGFADALSNGKPYVNFNLRRESVNQDNGVRDASALTLRTRLGYRTGEWRSLSALIELEDNRIVAGESDYTVGPTGFNPGVYSVIADPESTELDQAFVRYKSDNLVVKLGRQIIAYDGQRFIGHVGWRQDRQTFDALTLKASPLRDLTLNYGYVMQRNRIFADMADLDAKDHLLNAAYKTPVGTLGAYAYLLEVDTATANGLDTYGVSFQGKKKNTALTWLYSVGYATQDAKVGATTFDAYYLFAEGGVALSWATVKVGYEVLGSDNGAYGFATPLATLHKFNGWSDQFLGTPAVGLADRYVSVGGKTAVGNLLLAYHDFASDEAVAGGDDLGREWDVRWVKTFKDKYTFGLKLATYNAGNPAAGKVDTDKFWGWFSTGF